MNQSGCPLAKDKDITARRLTKDVLNMVNPQSISKMNAIWLEVTGCSGNIISFMNSDTPNLYENLTGIVNLKYSNMLMGAEGEFAFERFLETLADCPMRKWNGYVNWPVGDNSNCIGCTHRNFPDGMEPFVRY